MTHFQLTFVACGLCAATQYQAMLSIAGDASGAMPGDEIMTCQQLAAEAATTAAALSAGAMVSSPDPTGLSSRAYSQSEMALQREMWNRAQTEDKPLMDQAGTQANAAIGKAMPMQSNTRIQRLIQFVRQETATENPGRSTGWRREVVGLAHQFGELCCLSETRADSFIQRIASSRKRAT